MNNLIVRYNLSVSDANHPDISFPAFSRYILFNDRPDHCRHLSGFPIKKKPTAILSLLVFFCLLILVNK